LGDKALLAYVNSPRFSGLTIKRLHDFVSQYKVVDQENNFGKLRKAQLQEEIKKQVTNAQPKKPKPVKGPKSKKRKQPLQPFDIEPLGKQRPPKKQKKKKVPKQVTFVDTSSSEEEDGRKTCALCSGTKNLKHGAKVCQRCLSMEIDNEQLQRTVAKSVTCETSICTNKTNGGEAFCAVCTAARTANPGHGTSSDFPKGSLRTGNDIPKKTAGMTPMLNTLFNNKVIQLVRSGQPIELAFFLGDNMSRITKSSGSALSALKNVRHFSTSHHKNTVVIKEPMKDLLLLVIDNKERLFNSLHNLFKIRKSVFSASNRQDAIILDERHNEIFQNYMNKENFNTVNFVAALNANIATQTNRGLWSPGLAEADLAAYPLFTNEAFDPSALAMIFNGQGPSPSSSSRISSGPSTRPTPTRQGGRSDRARDNTPKKATHADRVASWSTLNPEWKTTPIKDTSGFYPIDIAKANSKGACANFNKGERSRARCTKQAPHERFLGGKGSVSLDHLCINCGQSDHGAQDCNLPANF
jgi:hypothetical protein